MATYPCIKGHFGSTDYYLTKINARELVGQVRPAQDMDEWATMDIDERMQRQANEKRIRTEIAPYLAKDKDRFFGSVIILVWRGCLDFEAFDEIWTNAPHAYKIHAKNMGFLTIEKGTYVILDGQHRLLAIQKVIKGEVSGEYAATVPDDDVSVIFIHHESNEKTRKIFNKVNRYAKPTTRSDNLITSEDDGNAIIARRLINEGGPFGIRNKDRKEIVDWVHNTLSARSIQLTTLSVIYETVKFILKENDKKLSEIERPSEEELDECYQIVENYWKSILGGIEIYQYVIKKFKDSTEQTSIIPKLRKEESEYSLLFKPAGQITFIRGLLMAEKHGIPLKDAVPKANKIKWSISDEIWKDIIVRSNGTIDTKSVAIERAAMMISYYISGSKMKKDQINEVKKKFNEARGNDNAKKQEELPPYICEG